MDQLKMQMLQSMLAGRDPQAMFNELIRTNPKFRDFVSENMNKTPQEIASRYGIDLNKMMK